MPIDHARRLHERVADRRAYESEASAFQVFRHRSGLVGLGGGVLSPRQPSSSGAAVGRTAAVGTPRGVTRPLGAPWTARVLRVTATDATDKAGWMAPSLERTCANDEGCVRNAPGHPLRVAQDGVSVSRPFVCEDARLPICRDFCRKASRQGGI